MNISKVKCISSFFENNIQNDKIICPACNIEHTGRNAYSIKIFLYLYDSMGETKYFDLAYMVAKNTISNLKSPKESNGEYKVFYPGLYSGSQNNSSNVIDSGMCTDMLSEFILFCKRNTINLPELDGWKNELKHHIDNYLLDASISKPCLNQRMWGLTGIATFYKLTKDNNLKEHIILSHKKLFMEQNEDGSFDYIVNRTDISSKFSLFYFPRLLAFVVYCMQCIDDYRFFDKIKKSIVLLIDCYDHRYNKILKLENKKWFFTASYEVESLVYDIYLHTNLSKIIGFSLEEIYLQQTELYLEHISEFGVNSNLESKPNLFCSFIDNADFMWLIRSNELKKNRLVCDFKYIKKNRNYCDAGINIKFYNGEKLIFLKNNDSFNSFWGVKDRGKVIVNDDKTIYTEPKNSYLFRFSKNLKKNIRYLRNVILLSKYNLSFHKIRFTFLKQKLCEFIKYDIIENI